MATGGVDEVSRMNCSVCLEPFRGRHEPKLLPCFHTFCLPCLSRLADKEMQQSVQTSASGEQNRTGESHKPSITITCPTCRSEAPVPLGGVANFQTNFYLEDCNKEDSAQAAPCDLCDGEEEAQHQCPQCQNSFCSNCRRCHDKLCRRAQVPKPQGLSDAGITAQGPSSSQVKEQLQMVEDCLKKLGEDKEKLAKEREAMEDSVHLRYAALIRHAGEAHEACLTHLRQVCEGSAGRLDAWMSEAQHARDTLQQQLSGSRPGPVSHTQLRAALFVQGELRTLLTRSTSAPLLRHEVDSSPQLADCLQSFLGKVLECGETPEAVQRGEAVRSSDPPSAQGALSSPEAGAPSLPAPHTKAWNELVHKVDDLASRVASLQSASLRREVTAVKDKNAKLSADQAGLQREVGGLRDKSAILHQDLAVAKTERDNMLASVAKLQKEVAALQARAAQPQSDIAQLKADLSSVAAGISSAQKDVATLQKDSDGTKQDLDQLKKDSAALKSDMKKETDQLKSDMKKSAGQLQSDVSGVQKSISDLKKDHSTACADLKASKSQVVSLERKVQSAQDSLQDKSKKITTLESQMLTASRQVAFHALLKNEVTTMHSKQTLICDDIVTNTGEYDGQTGIFTAPVSGVYCFMATTSPNKSDDSKQARLDLVLEDVRIGYAIASGTHHNTTHTAVKMNAGQRVWLKTYSDREYVFNNGWWTTFCGMLLQPAV